MGRTGRRNQKSNKQKEGQEQNVKCRKEILVGQGRNSKMKLNRSLRQMRKGNIERTEFIEEKQRHNKLYETKKEEEREREQIKIAEIQNETEIWRYIKKEKGR